jgi:long-chain acyl-CoA synthetase
VDARPWHRFYGEGVPKDIPPSNVPIHEFLRASAARHPHRPALVLGGPGFTESLSYRSLDRLSDRFAQALLRLGTRPGDRVAVALPNLPQYPIAVYGILKAGAVLVNVNPLYRGTDLAHILTDAGVRRLVTLTRLYPRVAEIRSRTSLEHVILTKVSDYFPPLWRLAYTAMRERAEGDAMPSGEGVLAWRRLLAESPSVPPRVAVRGEEVAVLQYTGGTTGVPRGAMLSHRNLAANMEQGLAWFRDLEDGKERFLLVVPLFHVYGLLALTAGVKIAATLHMALMRMFEAKVVADQIRRHRPTVFPGVPAMYLAITHLKNVEQYNLRSIRLCLSGAAELPAEVASGFERLTGSRLVEGYGLTEASPLVTANPIWEGGVRKIGSIGVPVPGTDVRIVDLETGGRSLPPGEAGELVVQGPQVMRGYWNAPAETAAAIRNGWLFTGDIARMDEDGFFYIVDRKKDMINVAGLNVYPREIEEILLTHPLVREAAVVGVGHPVRGEVIVAHIVLASEGIDPAAARTQIREFLRQRLPPYKIPRRVEFVQSIPRTLIGKPLRRVIRDTLRTKMDPDDRAEVGGED